MDSTHLQAGTDPQLFVDNWTIECTQGLTRRWHRPRRHPDSPLITADRPWEKTLYFTYSNYCVLRDPEDGLIKCWYEDLGELTGEGHPVLTRQLYAESEDGLHFRKPALDVAEIDGQATNVVMGYAPGQEASAANPWAEEGVHSCYVVLDAHPARAEERFRAIFSRSFYVEDGGRRHQSRCAHSADGLHWTPYEELPSFGSSGHHLSDVSCAFYDHDAREFVQNTRHGKMYSVAQPEGTPRVGGWFAPYYPHRPDLLNKRRVYQCRSHDFVHWSEPLPVSFPDDEVDNLDEAHYGMGQFRVGRLHFATLGVFRYVDDEMEVRLLYSRDGVEFRPLRRADPLLAPRGEGHWDAHMVSMTSPPVEMGDEWWFYHGGSACHHDYWMSPAEGLSHPEAEDPSGRARFGMGLAVLRREGFASLDASAVREGYLITRPLMSEGNGVTINGRCRRGGRIVAEVQTADGRVVEGCGLGDSDAFCGDEVAHALTWNGSSEVPGAGGWRRLRLHLRDAEIFGFRFTDGAADDQS